METKIQLSPSEIDLMCNADVILTKNKILQKVWLLLESIQSDLLTYQHRQLKLPDFLFNIGPKISKGENYKGLPYLILDYPRLFRPEGSCAIRSMFWWGNYFSSTLHLSGSIKRALTPTLIKNFSLLADAGYYVSIHPDPWQHHFEPTNYTLIQSITEESFAVACQEYDHIKIAAKWPLNNWPHAAKNLLESWKRFSSLGLINYPGDGTGL